MGKYLSLQEWWDESRCDPKQGRFYFSYGFFMYECSFKSLPNRSKRLVGRVRSMLRANAKGHRFDPTKVSIYFTNFKDGGDGLLTDRIIIADAVDGMTARMVITFPPSRSFRGKPTTETKAGDAILQIYDEDPESLSGPVTLTGPWNSLLDYFRGPRG